MKDNSALPSLLSPFSAGELSTKNRIVMAPMTRGRSPSNIPGPEVANYYRSRAEGGAGLIITECTFINHPASNGFADAPAFYGEPALDGWKHVVDEVHAAGGKIMPQIWHAGPSRSPGIEPHSNLQSIGPIDVYEHENKVTTGISVGEIATVVDAFGEAAKESKRLGFDGVEIHGAHSYLIDSFLWSQSNQRQDHYGGSIENRVRFASEIVTSAREAVGDSYPICFRFSQWKLSNYDAQIAQNAFELEKLLLPLVDSGVDIFHVSTRRFWQPAFPGSSTTLAGWTKKITGKPVIAVGSAGIDQQFSLDIFSHENYSQPQSVEKVEKMLANDEFDLIAVGRAILADPGWPNKILSGKLNEIIPFTSASLGTL